MDAADREPAENQHERSLRRPRRRRQALRACRRGVSLMEVMVVLTVMCILLSLAAPSFRRSMEQSRADIAGANLRAIWTAQRVYWLEYHTYTNDLTALETAGLLDPTIVAAADPYVYQIQSADTESFTVKATRSGSERWAGHFQMDEAGEIWGDIDASGQPSITPGFL
jgi:prepilin-type N-terminal cleavage/methylation domain-containing protein